ncbi:PucR family transcriptional regulator ligand-binding domain-containing protein [Streptomyces sp. NBC_00091]|uniref:helix-turn-helix domain-containing protein n=1 Tax=Streptomyces sp. NBC_00091 TaxID=2975648 RepID=UPI002252D7C2|nr:PucR family transcriptional regulator ligand-binding domain-containing protein [Streptomyces sp. NBC_00091]MCX5376115.1 PucR family transcriptional regulator ligand-binding domain-containing protein [Streptomyces sp. NBC_00091]
MRLRDLLDVDELDLQLLVGLDADDGVLDRAIRAVPTIDLADPGRFLTGGELVLTGLAWWREEGDAESFVRVLARAGVAALAAGEVEHGLVPHDLVRACRRHGVPLVAVRPETSFAAITEHVLRRLRGLRRKDVGSLAAVVERHRQLLTDRGAPDSVLELLREILGLDVRVLSPTGRQIAGARPPLHPKTAVALAARYLAARRAGEAAPHRVTIGERLYSLVPVRHTTGPATELGDWLVVMEADTANWPAADVELLDRIVELVADARSAHEGAKEALNDLAGRLLDLLRGGVPPEEIPVRLRNTAQAVVSQQDTWPREQFVVARGEWHGNRPIPAPALRVLLEEALVQPDGPVPVSPQDIAATVDGDRAVLFVLVPPTDALPEPALDCAALQQRLSAALARWLGPTDRVCVGVSSPVEEPGNARRALDEARNALRVAYEGPERVTVRGPDDLTTHILSLLPLIPAEARRAFATRLLGPLRDHDSRHRTDLLATLETFLDCDGSWTACAAQLHLHVNSLRHRIARIEHLTARDLTRLETRLDFLAALRAA